MMDSLKEWAISVCAAAVICAALDMLIPEHKYEKVLRLCLAAFALCVCIAPLSGLQSCGGEWRHSNKEEMQYTRLSSDLQQQVERQSAAAVEGAVSRIIDEKLRQLGFSSYEIAVKTDIAADGSITIGQVAVTLAGTSDAEAAAAQSALEQYLGIDITTDIQKTEKDKDDGTDRNAQDLFGGRQ